MSNCINIKSVEFQTKLKQSGLSEFDYAVQVQKYFDQQRRMGVPEDQLKFPELDMVDGANSSEYLSEQIKLILILSVYIIIIQLTINYITFTYKIYIFI